MACITFYVTWKRDFLQNVVKTNKKGLNRVVYLALRRKTIHYSVLVFSLKLHKLPYLNLFICFNNILKKISFSCYIKCNFI